MPTLYGLNKDATYAHYEDQDCFQIMSLFITNYIEITCMVKTEK